jgi:hypothetical protein
LPIAVLASFGSLAGLLFQDAIYGRETAAWAAQSVGQDIANLLAFPAMVVAALLAGRGSFPAYLVWMGLLVYSAYTYAIYSFSVHFGPLFLVWVAVFGLSVYVLVGAFARLHPLLQRPVARTGAEKLGARLLIAIGSGFGVLWLSEVVPAMLSGTTPEALREVGLLTNPVHVLDLALLLPAVVLAGALLRKGRPLGYVLAPVLLVATFFLGLGIVSLTLVSAARDLDAAPVVAFAVGTLAALEAFAARSLLKKTSDRWPELRGDAVPSTDHGRWQ